MIKRAINLRIVSIAILFFLSIIHGQAAYVGDRYITESTLASGPDTVFGSSDDNVSSVASGEFLRHTVSVTHSGASYIQSGDVFLDVPENTCYKYGSLSTSGIVITYNSGYGYTYTPSVLSGNIDCLIRGIQLHLSDLSPTNTITEPFIGTINNLVSGLNASGQFLSTSGPTFTKISSLTGGFANVITTNGQFALAVASIPDLNGDGTPDLVVGNPFDDDGGTDRGAVWILTMDTDGSVGGYKKISELSAGMPSFINSDLFGSSIASLGDINNDGKQEIAVGAFQDDTGGTNKGAIYIISLNSNGSVYAYVKIAENLNGFGTGLVASNFFGASIALVGDLDNNGVKDIAVGAYGDDTGGTDRGAVYILFMSGNLQVIGKQKLGSATGGFTGVLANSDNRGFSLSQAGDLNGDSIPDLLVGEPGDDSGGTDRGAIWVVYLNNNGTAKGNRKIAHGVGGMGTILVNADNFGRSIAQLGDLDNNGTPEILVGANRDDTGGADRGAAYILFMNADETVSSTLKIAHTTGGLQSGYLDNTDYFGYGLTSIDNSIGGKDIVIGAPLDDDGGTNRGALYYIKLGQFGTYSTVITGGALFSGWDYITHKNPQQTGLEVSYNFYGVSSNSCNYGQLLTGNITGYNNLDIAGLGLPSKLCIATKLSQRNAYQTGAWYGLQITKKLGLSYTLDTQVVGHTPTQNIVISGSIGIHSGELDTSNNTFNNSINLASADLWVNTQSTQISIYSGEQVVYSVTYGNSGARDAGAYMVSYSLPSTLNFVQSSAGLYNAGTHSIEITGAHLSTGQSAMAVITAIGNSSIVSGNNIANTGNISSLASELYTGNNTATVTLIGDVDSTLPNATIMYSTLSSTTGMVIATITGFSETGIFVSNNGGSTSYTFTGNGSFGFIISDPYGNTNTINATVNNIYQAITVNSQGGGGGASYLQQDICPGGDNSGSRYDRSCGISMAEELAYTELLSCSTDYATFYNPTIKLYMVDLKGVSRKKSMQISTVLTKKLESTGVFDAKYKVGSLFLALRLKQDKNNSCSPQYVQHILKEFITLYKQK